MVSRELRRELLGYSRALLEASLLGTSLPPTLFGDPLLEEKRGLFVTLRVRGLLRGCIGRIVAEGVLRETVHHCTLEAAFADRRFPPLEGKELEGLTIEHSLLSPPRPLRRPGDIRLGVDGVIFALGDARSVFLPEVPLEQGWDRAALLDALARKAGLPSRAWQDKRALFQVFRTCHYSEDGQGSGDDRD
ncbi:AmmeMemoRadiSam system protein A [Alkalispirochaeta alkalica]|uniref:AmmeMemoRadiSam system protein A n=1 Tax=Alkalispirochaeta alkalica TaxID=46356 RepID=UPI0003654D45|nr:AmmeMemoRadiSam system protein A [Alkalispirochaeta alkalica]